MLCYGFSCYWGLLLQLSVLVPESEVDYVDL